MECKANGCPLKVAHVTNKEKGWGVCQYHRIAPGEDWPAVTRRINDRLGIIRALSIFNALPDRFKPMIGEQLGQWEQRVILGLEAEILGEHNQGRLIERSEFDHFKNLQQIIDEANQ